MRQPATPRIWVRQRRPPGIIRTQVHPPESYTGLGPQLRPAGHVGHVSGIVDGIVFPESGSEIPAAHEA